MAHTLLLNLALSHQLLITNNRHELTKKTNLNAPCLSCLRQTRCGEPASLLGGDKRRRGLSLDRKRRGQGEKIYYR